MIRPVVLVPADHGDFRIGIAGDRECERTH